MSLWACRSSLQSLPLMTVQIESLAEVSEGLAAINIPETHCEDSNLRRTIAAAADALAAEASKRGDPNPFAEAAVREAERERSAHPEGRAEP